MDIVDFEEFDRRFELKAHEMSLEVKQRKEQGTVSVVIELVLLLC